MRDTFQDGDTVNDMLTALVALEHKSECLSIEELNQIKEYAENWVRLGNDIIERVNKVIGQSSAVH